MGTKPCPNCGGAGAARLVTPPATFSPPASVHLHGSANYNPAVASARWNAIASAILKARQSENENDIIAIAEQIRESEFDLMCVCRAAMLEALHWEVMRAYEVAGTASRSKLVEALGADFVEKSARIISDAGEGMLAVRNLAASQGTMIQALRGQSTSSCVVMLMMGIGFAVGAAKAISLFL